VKIYTVVTNEDKSNFAQHHEGLDNVASYKKLNKIDLVEKDLFDKILDALRTAKGTMEFCYQKNGEIKLSDIFHIENLLHDLEIDK
jgi:hypothetical protein